MRSANSCQASDMENRCRDLATNRSAAMNVAGAGTISRWLLASIALMLLAISDGLIARHGAAMASEQQAGLIEGLDKLPAAEIEARLPAAHPANYYVYAVRLWRDGEKDKAVFWLYVGELRYRFLLLTEPNTDPSGDPALFGSLRASLGQPIVLYAGSDTSKWSEQIDRALLWDDSNPNDFTSKSKYKKQWRQARGSLAELKSYILAHADEIRRQRAQEGVGEVGVKDGVYTEEHRQKMPADWPPLEAATAFDSVVGSYKADWHLGHTLFFGEGPKAVRAERFEFSKAGPGEILIVAKRGDDELVRRTAGIREQDGAVVFEGDTKPDYMSSGGIHETVFLRLNVVGDLVVQGDWLQEGQFQNKSMPVREANTFWFRVPRLGAQ